MTYAQLNAAASRAAMALRRLQPERGRCIGVMLPASFDAIVAMLAVLKSGNAYVPLDPATPPARLARMLDDASIDAVIAFDGSAVHLPDGCRSLTIADLADYGGADDVLEQVLVPGSELAYVMFTSGSTGVPKGVMVPHRGIVNYLAWCRRTYPVTAGAGVPLCSPLWSDMSITSVFLPLISGSRVVVLDQDDVVEELDTAMRSGEVFSFVKLTPAHLEALRSLSLGRGVPRNTAAFVVGGESLFGETLTPWREQDPDLMIFNEYGPTETVVGCSVHATRAGDVGPGPVPIGRPIANTRLYVLDRHKQPVPAGVRGELYIGGVGVARGYVNGAELTGARFLPDPFLPGERVYRTGDLVKFLPDGALEYVGRVDHQLKIRGYRIEPGDIETALRRHPAVADAVVRARDVGAVDRRLVAYVVLSAEARILATDVVPDLRAFLRRELPAYMVPSSIVVIGRVPLSPAGKVDMRALEKSWSGEAPRRDTAEPPATDIERVIALVFEDVLGAKGVSANDDFFADLGGHSLLATMVVARLRQLLRIELPLRWVFESPTVRSLAQRIDTDSTRGATAAYAAAMVFAILGLSDDQVRERLESQHSTPSSGSGSSPCA